MKRVLATLAFFIFSCAPTYKSLPNHVELTSSDIPLVKQAIINDWASSGYMLQGSDDFSLTFTKQMGEQEGIFYRALLGNQLSYTPEWNTKFTFVILAGGRMNVFYNVALTEPNAMGAVKRNDLTSEKPGKDVNDYLVSINKRLAFVADAKEKGRLGIQFTNKVVQKVVEGTPADSGGVKLGDELVSVNDSLLSGEQGHDFQLLTGAPETLAKIKLVRSSDTLTVNLVRKKIDVK